MIIKKTHPKGCVFLKVMVFIFRQQISYLARANHKIDLVLVEQLF